MSGRSFKMLRIILSLLLVLTICFLAACSGKKGEPDEGQVPPPSAPAENPPQIPPATGFVPVLRFAITSDVHVRSSSNDYGSRQKLASFLTSAYGYANTQPYSALDGIFIVGDLTQDGKTAEYDAATALIAMNSNPDTEIRVVMGNHEMHAYGSGDARFEPENIAKSTERFKSKLAYGSENSHTVINGYHFITLSNDLYETRNYFDGESLSWLKGEIEAAMADDPTANKPIFVMQHEPPYANVRGFTGGDTELGELLKNYPRVIDFSGHTHRPIIDPQSIWQDGFTAIGTGGLAYLGFNMAGHPTLDNSAVAATDDEGGYIGGASNAERTGAMYYIVEVDAENNVRLKVYDILSGGFYGEPVTFKVGEGEAEIFTPDRAERSVAPTFGNDARIEVLSDDYNYPVIRFSTPTGGDLTQYYRIEMWADGADEPSAVNYRLAGMHKAANMPKTATAPLREWSSSGAYTLKIYAVNCWGKESAPLVGGITIGAPNLTPDILNTVFNTDGTAGGGLTLMGSTEVIYDADLERNIGRFSGAGAYKFEGIADYYDRIAYSISLEAYFKVGSGVAGNMAIAANNNSSGFGLIRMADGSLRFNYSVNNGGGRKYLNANTAPGVAREGEWVHAVAVYARDSIKIYVNGSQVELYNDSGNPIGNYLDTSGRLFEKPSGITAALVVGGDINVYGSYESAFVGDISTLGIFSRALTAEEVGELYSLAK